MPAMDCCPPYRAVYEEEARGSCVGRIIDRFYQFTYSDRRVARAHDGRGRSALDCQRGALQHCRLASNAMSYTSDSGNVQPDPYTIVDSPPSLIAQPFPPPLFRDFSAALTIFLGWRNQQIFLANTSASKRQYSLFDVSV